MYEFCNSTTGIQAYEVYRVEYFDYYVGFFASHKGRQEREALIGYFGVAHLFKTCELYTKACSAPRPRYKSVYYANGDNYEYKVNYVCHTSSLYRAREPERTPGAYTKRHRDNSCYEGEENCDNYSSHRTVKINERHTELKDEEQPFVK